MNIKVIKSLTGYYNILEMAEKQGEPKDSYWNYPVWEIEKKKKTEEKQTEPQKLVEQ